MVVHAGEGVDPEEAAAAEADWVRAHAPTTAAAAAAGDASGGDVARGRRAGTSSRPSSVRDAPLRIYRGACSTLPSRFAIGGGGDERRETSLTIPRVRTPWIVAGRNDASTATTPPAAAGRRRLGGSLPLLRGVGEQSERGTCAGRAGRTGPASSTACSARRISSIPRRARAARDFGQCPSTASRAMRAMGMRDRVARFPFYRRPEWPPRCARAAHADDPRRVATRPRALLESERRLTMSPVGRRRRRRAHSPSGEPWRRSPSVRGTRACSSPRCRPTRGVASRVAVACVCRRQPRRPRGGAATVPTPTPRRGRTADVDSRRRLASLRDDARACSTTKTATTRAPPRARALVAYERSSGCARRARVLRRATDCMKTMREMSDLRRQPLRGLAAATDGGGG